MLIWALLGILVLFVLFVLLRPAIYSMFGVRVCAVCAAVCLTWLFLLVLKLAGMDVSSLLIGILMGQSVAGLMYTFEAKVRDANKHGLLWLKIVIVLVGTLFVYVLLSEGFNKRFFVVLIFAFIISVIVSQHINMTKKAEPVRRGFSEEIKKLEEKFEHCCD